MKHIKLKLLVVIILAAAGIGAWPSSGLFNVYRGPCDIINQSGASCVATYSVTRPMLNSYTGSLFQLTRGSDSTTHNVGFNPGTHQADVADAASFCAATTCTITMLYDQSGRGNDLTVPTVAPAYLTTTFPNGTVLPLVQNRCDSPCIENAPHSIYVQGFNRLPAQPGMPTGSQSITVYKVFNTFAAQFFSSIGGDFNNTEATNTDNGPGHIFGVGYCKFGGVFCANAPTYPQITLELEEIGPAFPGVVPNYPIELAKHRSGVNTTTLKYGDATKGGFTTLYSGVDIATAAMEGGIALGPGGDNTPIPDTFYEGTFAAGATTDAVDSLLKANVAAYYAPFMVGGATQHHQAFNFVGSGGSVNMQTLQGNTVIVGISWAVQTPTPTVASVTMSGGETCSQVPGAANNSVNGLTGTDVWYCLNTAGGNPETVTVAMGGGTANFVGLGLSEWSGLSGVAHLGNNSNGTGTSISQATNGATTQTNNEIVYSVERFNGADTITAGQHGLNQFGGLGGNFGSYDEYQASGAPGVYTNTFSGTANVAWSSSIAAFQHQ